MIRDLVLLPNKHVRIDVTAGL